MNFTFVLHAPQILWITLATIGVITTLFLHNTVAKRIRISSSMIIFCLGILLQFWGGVFTTFGMPQIVLLAIWVTSFFSLIPFSSTVRFDIFSTISNTVAMFGILYWAGFFGGAQ